ncbi:hypothetical protein [Spirosoma fluviale]|uniref:Curlin associated repeat-containing protein n=1 Tax=Spirosoma fluviale TaxID=1597977 RepID=A0A286G0A3_9BACT|nr:hypothetical protein [Spirosoma fluviale]SOD88872.1 hypothetical protein SAMN06269250_2872 [Spirosoma fluviale]
MRPCILLLFGLFLIAQAAACQTTSEAFVTQLTNLISTGTNNLNPAYHSLTGTALSASFNASGGNELISQQAGNNNTVVMQSTGMGNQLQALQKNATGSDNQIELQLTGDNNSYQLTQDGSNNVFQLPNATTSNAQLEVIQEGNGNHISSLANLITTSSHVIIHQTGGMKIQLLPPN